MPRKVEKTRNGGQWTEARYFGFIRSSLRAAFMRWGPKSAAKTLAREYTDDGVRYRCAECDDLYTNADTQVDHIKPCGSLRSYADLPGFVQRMFCEVDGFQVLCKDCHQIKTNQEKASRKKK
jgi:hypothetical protein